MFSQRFESGLEETQVALMELADRVSGDFAFQLAAQYRKYLTQSEAPPHSTPYTVPHAYDGWKPGGFFWAGIGDDIGTDAEEDLTTEAWLSGGVSQRKSRALPDYGDRHKNNTVAGGNVMGVPFAADQTDNLANYIEASAAGGVREGYNIGMAQSHISGRENNYLVLLDQGMIPGVAPRPWVDEIYDQEWRDIRDSILRPVDTLNF